MNLRYAWKFTWLMINFFAIGDPVAFGSATPIHLSLGYKVYCRTEALGYTSVAATLTSSKGVRGDPPYLMLYTREIHLHS